MIKNILFHIHELMESNEDFTDIHIEQGRTVVWRLPTGWVETGYGKMHSEEMLPLLNAVSTHWKSLLKEGRAINKTIPIGKRQMRCIVYHTRSTSAVAATLRILPIAPPKIESLGLPVQVYQFCTPRNGLLLVAGATGVGKSTTISAIIERINEQLPLHIVTIEDPIEILYECKRAIITQREVGRGCDVESFAQGVNESMRQCPDVLVIGEIRDADTAAAAIRAAESGHYVIASLHAKSAIASAQKLLSFFGEDERIVKSSSLANVFLGSIYQTMLPSKDGKRNVVAAEVVVGHAQDVVAAAIHADKMLPLEERLAKGQMPGCVSLQQSMKMLGLSA